MGRDEIQAQLDLKKYASLHLVILAVRRFLLNGDSRRRLLQIHGANIEEAIDGLTNHLNVSVNDKEMMEHIKNIAYVIGPKGIQLCATARTPCAAVSE